MIFKQSFEPISSTYTYLLGCEKTGQALLIDPVLQTWGRDLAEVSKRGLKLAYTVETHIHADHITSGNKLKEMSGSRIAMTAMDQLPCADVGIVEGVPLVMGSLELMPIHTPGHTDNHFAFAHDGRLHTGDAVLIEACGCTDFQGGDPPTPVTGSDLKDLRPEALFAPPGSNHAQLLSDDGGVVIAGIECKKLPEASQSFRSLTITPRE